MATWDDSLDLTVEVDEDGGIEVASKAARRRLAAASGRWRLLPSAGDLLLLQRVDEAAGDHGKPPPGVGLCGEIDGPGALANVLNFVHFSQWDGALSSVAGMTRKSLFFKRGQLLSAHSNLPEDRLGALLVRFGLLREEDLLAAVREVTPQRRLGTILVERGLMSAHDLYEGVRRQVEEIFFSVLLFRRGVFYFIKQLDEAAVSARLHLDTQSLLLEGLRRIDEMSYFRAQLPSAEVVLCRRQPPPAGELEGHALAVYLLVDDNRSLGEVARDSKLGEFAATKAAFELCQTGYLTVRETADLRRAPVPDAALPAAAAGEIIDAYSGALARLYGALSAKGKAAQLREGVTAFLSGSVRFAELFRDVALADDGKLPRRQLLANVDGLPDGERLELLQTALSELLMFVLFVVGDAIDRREQQELHERVAKALERLPRAQAHPAAGSG